MTIDSGWVKVLKSGSPQAFTDSPPLTPNVVFIDGQIKLMKAAHITTWQQFIKFQFYNTIEKAFDTGATVVVMGFDNYKHVPSAKHMTQRKRSQHVPVMDFDQFEELPSTLPQYWDAAMRNRSFKVKVMNMVINNVRVKYESQTHRTVILDFTDDVEVLGKQIDLPSVLQQARDTNTTLRRGECDIKAFPYSELGTLLIHSTDGDYVPMALVQIERAIQENRKVPTILLQRIKVHTGQKRRMAEVTGDKDITIKRNTRQLEFVNINMLYIFLRKEMPNTILPAHMFAGLVAMTGCDFTQNLPQLGPIRLWTNRHAMCPVNQATRKRDADPTSMLYIMYMICAAYMQLFSQKMAVKHPMKLAVEGEDAIVQYDEIARGIINNPKIAESTKASVWKSSRMLAHAKNTAWTVQYWSKLHDAPDALGGDWGFGKKGVHVEFEK
jgi:hypothetical protein